MKSLLFCFLIIFGQNVNAKVEAPEFDIFSPKFSQLLGSLIDLRPPTIDDYADVAPSKLQSGSHVIVCENETVLLDLFEGRKKYQYSNLNGQSYVDIVKEVIKRLSVLDKYRAFERDVDSLSYYLDHFLEKVQFTDYRLIDLPDLSIGTKPRDCDFQTLSVNAPLVESNYLIDNILWSQLSELSKAMLIVHDYFLKDYAREGQTQTFFLRKLVSLIFSNEFESVVNGMSSQYSEDENFRAGLVFYNYFRLFRHRVFGHNIKLVSNSFEQSQTIKFTMLDTFAYSGPFDYIATYGRQFVVRLKSSATQEFFLDGSPRRLVAADVGLTDYLSLDLTHMPKHLFVFPLEELIFNRKNGQLAFMRQSVSSAGTYYYTGVGPGQVGSRNVSTRPYTREQEIHERLFSNNYIDKIVLSYNMPKNLYFESGEIVTEAMYLKCIHTSCDSLYDLIPHQGL